ncbi:MAG: DUF4093 domain-containing protein [Oscillospiraceae bacterium]|jgi:ribonuclease M5|nr:DUF4093 domain-containing protein [Oscillospiraceae bacterium]
MERLTLHKTVIVEGRYDKAKVLSVADCDVLQTNGFALYRDKEKQAFIRKMASERGVIVLTDSDNAGRQLRTLINNITKGIGVTHIYTPDVFGKERRKPAPSSEGKLGVEGIDGDVLRQLLASHASGSPCRDVTNVKSWLFDHGYIGQDDSAAKRRLLLTRLSLPDNLSTNDLCRYIARLSDEEYAEIIQ